MVEELENRWEGCVCLLLIKSFHLLSAETMLFDEVWNSCGFRSSNPVASFPPSLVGNRKEISTEFSYLDDYFPNQIRNPKFSIS